jgi:hypothetical protein
VFISANCSFAIRITPDAIQDISIHNYATCAAKRDYCEWEGYANYTVYFLFNMSYGMTCKLNRVVDSSNNTTTEGSPVAGNTSNIDECEAAGEELRADNVAIRYSEMGLEATLTVFAEECFNDLAQDCLIDFKLAFDGQIWTSLVVACVEAGGVVLASMNCTMKISPSATGRFIILNYGLCGVSQEEYPACDSSILSQLALPRYETNCTVNEVFDKANYNITSFREQCSGAVRELTRSHPTLGKAIDTLFDSTLDTMMWCGPARNFTCYIDHRSPEFYAQFESLRANCTDAGGTFVTSDCTFSAMFSGLDIDFELKSIGSCLVVKESGGRTPCDPSRFAEYALYTWGANATDGTCYADVYLPVPTPPPSGDADSDPSDTVVSQSYQQCQMASADALQDSPELAQALEDFVLLRANKTMGCIYNQISPCNFDLMQEQNGQAHEKFFQACSAAGGVFVSANCSYSTRIGELM